MSDKKQRVPVSAAMAWMSGAVFYAAVLSLVQVGYGLEGYIAHLRTSWLAPSIAVPAAIVIGLIAMVVLKKASDWETNQRARDDELIKRTARLTIDEIRGATHGR